MISVLSTAKAGIRTDPPPSIVSLMAVSKSVDEATCSRSPYVDSVIRA
jgi:hypothetical protein